MANTTVYPFGTGGSLPSNIGIINDLVTGGADKALSAEQGKVIGQEMKNYIGHGKNLFDSNDPDYIPNRRLESGGVPVNSAIHAVSGFIPFTQEQGFMCCSTAGGMGSSNLLYNAVYDSNKQLVASWDMATQNYVEWQEGVAYARFTIINYANGNIQIEVGKVATAYEPYSYGIIGEKVLRNSLPGTSIKDNSIPASKLLGGTSLNGDIAYSSLGGDSRLLTADGLSNDTLLMTSYPRFLKRSRTISVSADITSFHTIHVGVAGGDQQANRYYVKVDQSKVSLCHLHENATSVVAEETHGLTFASFIKVAFTFRNGKAKVVLSTLADFKAFDMEADPQVLGSNAVESYGYPFLRADNSTSLSNIVMRVGTSDLGKAIWVFGDSYVSLYEPRWPYHLLPAYANIDNYALFGLAGSNSATMLADLESALETNVPKYLVWTLGMNEADSASNAPNGDWKRDFDTVAGLCTTHGITLIAATIPNVPDRLMAGKNTYVKNSGYRYIDFAKAVNAEEAGATWYPGCLASDNVHPTVAGAKVLASQVLEDFPEIMNQM